MAEKGKARVNLRQAPMPSVPYQRGKAPALLLCEECKCWMPKQHDCVPIE